MRPTELPGLKSLKSLSEPLNEKAFESCLQSETPKILRYAFFIFFACLILGIAGALFLPWQQVSVGQGRVIAYSAENRSQNIEAPVVGRIKKWFIKEGVLVKSGQPLVELSDVDPEIMKRLRVQEAAYENKIRAGENALALSRKNLVRQESLAKQGLSSQRAYELAQIEVAKYESELASARSQLSELQVKLSRQASQIITADSDGTLVRILVPQGGVLVSAGDPLAVLVPDTEDRAVELLISGVDLPLLSVGRKARLQFEGWPAVQFTGWPSAAVGTFGGVVKVIDAVDDGQGNYRVLIFPDPDDHPWPNQTYLRQGVRVVGWVLLSQVKLGWELWRKLNGFPMTVPYAESDNKKK